MSDPSSRSGRRPQDASGGNLETSGSRRHGGVTRALHWATALAVAVMVPSGVLMTSAPLEPVSPPLYILHKGLGALLLIGILARVAWRVTHRPPPHPEGVPPFQTRLAGATHAALYAALVLAAVSGYVRTVGDGFPIEALDALGIPPLLPRAPGVAAAALVAHQIAAYALTALVAVHVSAAVHDLLFDGGRIFRRMWPPRAGG